MKPMVTCDNRYVISPSLWSNTRPRSKNPISTCHQPTFKIKHDAISTNNFCNAHHHIQFVNKVYYCYNTNLRITHISTTCHSFVGINKIAASPKNSNLNPIYKNSNANTNIHSTNVKNYMNVNKTYNGHKTNRAYSCNSVNHTPMNANKIYNNSDANRVCNSIHNTHMSVNRTHKNYITNRACNRINKSHVIARKIYNSYDATDNATSAGQINRLVLSNGQRLKLNTSSDREFYSFPRFVTHVDDAFISNLTKVYRERIPAGAEVLDLMSSWVSHLPPEVQYKRVVGHGLNAQELARNPRLDYFFVKDLNEDPTLEAKDCSFDAVVCTVSAQYLQQPEKVFAEIYRILRPGGVCIVSFSNRMFYEKAIGAWREGTDYSRIQLVVQYFQCVTGFTQPEVVKKMPESEGTSPFGWLLGFLRRIGRDPFNAVIAYRNFKPI